MRKIPVERRTISRAEIEGNLVSRLFFFPQIPPNMIYLFNYTECYLEHWLNKYYLLFVVFGNIRFVLLDSG